MLACHSSEFQNLVWPLLRWCVLTEEKDDDAMLKLFEALPQLATRKKTMVRRLFYSVALLAWLPLGKSSERCPPPTDPCMNEDNYRQCLGLVDLGCQQLLLMESCPLQFACADQEPNEREEDDNDDEKEDEDEANVDYDACVTLLVYQDEECTGDAINEFSFPTMSKPGSPWCKRCLIVELYAGPLVIYGSPISLLPHMCADHDTTMPKISASDQYCNPTTGNWHQTMYLGSETCEDMKPWWKWLFWHRSIKLTYTSDSCVGGFVLKRCDFHPCPSSGGGGDEETADEIHGAFPAVSPDTIVATEKS
jgi:hypothetical protein